MVPTLPRSRRRGATLVEAAVSISLFLTLVVGMLDLGITLFRRHVLSQAARQGARIAIVHGYLAPNHSAADSWGPTPSYFPALGSRSLYADAAYQEVRADDPNDALAAAIRPYLPGIDPSTVTLQIAWPEGDNDVGNRVTVTVTAPASHVLRMFATGPGAVLGASSTMTIVH
jgi:hypothetical protein